MSGSAVIFSKKIFLERHNYSPQRNCTKNEIECTNSYNHTICVKEDVKDVACAQYSTSFCYDDEFYINICETDIYKSKHIINR